MIPMRITIPIIGPSESGIEETPYERLSEFIRHCDLHVRYLAGFKSHGVKVNLSELKSTCVRVGRCNMLSKPPYVGS
jgi:hypothetical protein